MTESFIFLSFGLFLVVQGQQIFITPNTTIFTGIDGDPELTCKANQVVKNCLWMRTYGPRNKTSKVFCKVQTHSGGNDRFGARLKTDISAFSSGLQGHLRSCLTILDSSRRPLSKM
jgi:hypothetical protein